jgi:hypothetical protein
MSRKKALVCQLSQHKEGTDRADLSRISAFLEIGTRTSSDVSRMILSLSPLSARLSSCLRSALAPARSSPCL